MRARTWVKLSMWKATPRTRLVAETWGKRRRKQERMNMWGGGGNAVAKGHELQSIRCCFSQKVNVLVTESCLTLCDPTNCNPPGSSVHGILRARILEWVAIPFSRGSLPPRNRIRVSTADFSQNHWRIHFWSLPQEAKSSPASRERSLGSSSSWLQLRQGGEGMFHKEDGG